MKNRLIGGLCARAAAVMLAILTAGVTVGATGILSHAEEVTTMSAQNATIKGDSVNTRSGAGTGFDKVEALPGGTEVTVTGQATDGDGKVWYQVTLPSGKTAFVRNDFLELGDVIEEEPAEPETPAEPEEPAVIQPEEPAETAAIMSSQYVALYEQDDQGTYYWYLHDNDNSYRVKIDDLLAAARSVDEIDAIEKSNKTLKMALIIMAIVLVILVVILIILIFRLRDYMYYEDDEEDEEEEQPRRSSSFVKRRRDEEEEEEEEVPRGRGGRADVGRAARGGRDFGEDAQRGAGRAGRGVREEARPQRTRESEQQRRARNVMKEDDDLEYEYLNLDDE
ncbi:MAG: SH3 domain-containing protein [Lachnospiraceae bacterium]|nr:SH3 domain-containing protein [Lachnospiraceae bacterium]